jgi:hypothetical protein
MPPRFGWDLCCRVKDANDRECGEANWQVLEDEDVKEYGE